MSSDIMRPTTSDIIRVNEANLDVAARYEGTFVLGYLLLSIVELHSHCRMTYSMA